MSQIEEEKLNEMIRNIPQDVLATVAEQDQARVLKTFLSKPPSTPNFDGDSDHIHIAVIGHQSKDLILMIKSSSYSNAIFSSLPPIDQSVLDYVRLHHVLWYSLVILIGAMEDSLELAMLLYKQHVQFIYLQTGLEEDVWNILKRERRRNPNSLVSCNFWQKQARVVTIVAFLLFHLTFDVCFCIQFTIFHD